MRIEIKLIPDGIDPAKEIQDGTPVDKMEDACPIATQDAETNEENKRFAIKDHQYGTAVNPEESCGVCAAFNISPEMQECMQDESGEVGYCQMLKFMCSASNSCSDFAPGGPIEDMDD